MSQKRVLFISPTARVGGGAEVVLTNLVRYLPKLGYDCAIAAPADGEYAEVWESMGCAHYHFPVRAFTGEADIRSFNIRFYLTLLRAFLATNLILVRICRNYRPDVVYVNSFWAVFYVAFLVRLLRLKLIWHVHDLIRANRFNRIALTAINPFPNKVVVISNAVGSNLTDCGVNPSKIMRVYNGIDLDAFTPEQSVSASQARSTLGLSNHNFVILNVGRMIPRKGQDTLLKSAGILDKRFPHVRTIIVGAPYEFNGEQYQEALLRLTADLGITDKVLFTGWQSDISKYMLVADVIVSSSWAEPFGLNIVEAMAMGRPVVATCQGAEAEIVCHGNTGLLVPPKDEYALADAIATLILDNALRERLGKAAIERAHAQFSVTRFAREIAQIIET